MDGLKKFLRWLVEPALTILLTVFATTAIAQPFYVPSGSMEPTLEIGDYLIGAKFSYGYSRYSPPVTIGPQSRYRLFGRTPLRGDVVVFRLPRDIKQTYVKRVIGLPGDRVQMKEGRLFLNGKILPLVSAGRGMVEESNGDRHAIDRYSETLPGGAQHTILKKGFDGLLDNTEEFTVPPFHIFVMGDNRDNSLDSRVPAEAGGVGFVPMENLMARAEITIGSVDYLNVHSLTDWITKIRPSRFLHSI